MVVTVVTPYRGSLTFPSMSPELGNALSEAWLAYNRSATVLANGVRVTLDSFLDGWLLDNCPLNVIFGQGWIAGQQEALQHAGRACGSNTYLPVPPASAPNINQPPISTLPRDIAPSQTPPPIGTMDGGTSPRPITATDTAGGLTIMPGKTYRLILQTAPGRVDTGATYPLCSRSNTDACKPIQFATIQDAVNYANAHNEIPLQVSSVDEVWAIVEGRIPVNEANVLGGDNTMIWIAAGIAAVFILPKLLKKRSV